MNTAYFRAQKRPSPQPTYLYLMACGDAVKVGIAVDVERRRRAIQMCCPDEVTVLRAVLLPDFGDALSAERKIHDTLADKRTYGEWFRVPAVVVLEMLGKLPPYQPTPAKAPEPSIPDYSDDDEVMTKLRVAAKSLEF